MPGRVVVEVDRVDVLVLLRRVLRVGDRAVGAHGEPLRVLGHPRVVRARTAARSPARPPCRGPRRAATNASKSSIVPSSGSIASCPPSAEPIAHGEPTSPGGAGGCHRGVCCGPCGAPCRPGGSAAGRPRRSPSPRSRSSSLAAVTNVPCTAPAGLVAAAGGAGEELVPGAEQRALAVHVDLLRPAAGDQLPDRPLGHDRVHGREQRRGRPGRAAAARCRAARWPRRTAGRGWARSAGRRPTRCSSRAPISRSLASSSGVWPASSFTVTACRHVAHGSLHASTRNVHSPGSSAATTASNRSVPDPRGSIRTCWAAPRLPTLLPDDVGGDGVVPLAPDRGPDRDDLADDGLARMPPVADRGA